MADWQPGDLALCVRGGCLPENIGDAPEYPRSGRIYEVARVVEGRFSNMEVHLGLDLRNGPINRDASRVWFASRFRKIHPLNEAERATAMRELNAPAREKVS